MEKDYLVLKRASTSRSSGEWNEDDFDTCRKLILAARSGSFAAAIQ